MYKQPIKKTKQNKSNKQIYKSKTNKYTNQADPAASKQK